VGLDPAAMPGNFMKLFPNYAQLCG
jgi:hypothetical protein